MKKFAAWGLPVAGLLAACGDAPIAETMLDPQLTLVTPSAGFIGRVVELQISAAETHFDSTSLVSLGDPGITISNVAVGNRENLRLTATVAATAQLGAHDVTVTTAGSVARLLGGFVVRPSLAGEPPPLGVTPPPAMQGGLTTVYTRNLDYVQNPWNPSVLNTRLSLGLNSIGSATVLTGARFASTVLVDALAPPGTTVTTVATSLNPFVQLMYYLADPLDPSLPKPAPRTPTMVTPGTALPNQVFANPSDNGFFSLSSTQDNQILLAQVSSLGAFLQPPNGSLQGAVAPASGRFSDGNFGLVTYNAAGTQGTLLGLLGSPGLHYLTLWPSNFGGGSSTFYGYTLTPRLVPGTRFNATEPQTPDSPSGPLAQLTALDANSGRFATDGSFDRQGDTDYILYTAVGAVSRLLVAVSSPGTSISLVEYQNSTCTGAPTVSSTSNHFSAIDIATTTMLRCIAISATTLTQRYPAPYKIIIAAQ